MTPIRPNQFAGELSADRFTVKKLLELARAGKLRIPPFQRPLRWRRPDHLLLLDSLYHRYPVGTLLLWQRPAPASTVVFGGFAVAAREDAQAYWIVDGQQRITSIVGCLLQPDDIVRRRPNEFSFWFDLEKEQFVDAVGTPAPHMVPVNQLHDPVQTSRWARANAVSDELHERAQKVGSRLLSYEVPTYVTLTESDEILRTIFARANTAGRRMRQAEVFEALNKGLKRDDSPAGLTERLQEVLHALDFGKVDGDDLQRALVGVAGFNPRDRLPEPLTKPGAAADWERPTTEALRRTVEFLRDAARIPHARVLPYALPLIILPRFFHRFPSPRERTIELLVRWVWRGVARGSHMATNQNFNPIHRAFEKHDEEEIVQDLLSITGRSPPGELPHSIVYNPRGAKTRLELAVLLARGPRHLDKGHPLSPVEIFEEALAEDLALFEGDAAPEDREPIWQLPAIKTNGPALDRSIALRFLHPAMSGERQFATALSRASDELLRGHAIPARAFGATRNQDWTRVAEARQDTIRHDVEEMVNRMARWDEDGDVPSIAAIIGEEDESVRVAP